MTFCCYGHSSFVAITIAATLAQCWILNCNAFVFPVISNPAYYHRNDLVLLPRGSSSCPRTPALCAKSGGDEEYGKRKGYSGKGFGNNNMNSRRMLEALEKTYGEEQTMKYKDIVIDNEAAMSEFFATNAEWHPLFRSIMMSDTSSSLTASIKRQNDLAAAFDILSIDEEEEIIYHESSPWKKLDAIPTQQEKLDVVATWLDSVQKSLVDLPVNESNSEKDDLDMHFINEGKRLLAITRFHVVLNKPSSTSSSLELFHRDELFTTCWSELAELRRANQPDTGEAYFGFFNFTRTIDTTHSLIL
jgi:hypothetical protein